MHHILILGAGKIGSLIAYLLASAEDYIVYLTDIQIHQPLLQQLAEKQQQLKLSSLDASNHNAVKQFLRDKHIQTIVSCLPYYRNSAIVRIAQECELNYFDLTEDIETAHAAAESAANTTHAIVPQCGLAPGLISIVAYDLMRDFSDIDTVKMRTGALPLNSSNALQYALTWSTEGLINQYGNPCPGIDNGNKVLALPLDDLEEIKIDGLTYEAFNTSGGLGTLVETCFGKVNHLSYKTIRYPGHCEKMRFLMHDLKLNADRDTLKRLLEHVIPKTAQDVVLIYASVTGIKDGLPYEKNYVKKFYPQTLNGLYWTAIQLTTASALCAVLDIVIHNPTKYTGLIRQEQFTLKQLVENRFGDYFNSMAAK